MIRNTELFAECTEQTASHFLVSSTVKSLSKHTTMHAALNIGKSTTISLDYKHLLGIPLHIRVSA